MARYFVTALLLKAGEPLRATSVTTLYDRDGDATSSGSTLAIER